jgi:hypothetical protein
MTSRIRLTYLGVDGEGEDASAQALDLLCELKSTLVAVAADCPQSLRSGTTLAAR